MANFDQECHGITMGISWGYHGIHDPWMIFGIWKWGIPLDVATGLCLNMQATTRVKILRHSKIEVAHASLGSKCLNRIQYVSVLYIYVYMFFFTYTYVYINIQSYPSKNEIYTYIYIYIYVYIYMCIYIHIYIYIHMYRYIYIYIYTYV